MNGIVLEVAEQEKDLGVLIQMSLKPKHHIAEVKTANMVLGIIQSNFTYKSADIIIPLYKSLVRPNLEYCVLAWSPYTKHDIDLIKKM